MYFKGLPDYLKVQIEKLTRDDVFQERFANDEILDELDQQKINMVQEFQSLKIIYGIEKQIKQITLASWSYLWSIKNAMTDFDKIKNFQISEFDIDIFYYIIQNGVKSIDIHNLLEKAIGYSKKIGFDDFEKAILNAVIMIKRSFKPLTFFPTTQNDQRQAAFDAQWVTKSVGIVAEMTNFDANYIIHQLPLHSVCYYFVQYAKKNGDQSVHKRTPEQILEAQDERACQLILDYLAQTGKITNEQKKMYFNIMTTKIK